MRAQIVKASSEVRSMILDDVGSKTAMARDEGGDVGVGGGGGVEDGGGGMEYQYDNPRSN